MKKFYFGQYWQSYGRNSIEVPDDFTIEQAQNYVKEHWDDIGLASSANYVSDSDEADFDNCGFETDETESPYEADNLENSEQLFSKATDVANDINETIGTLFNKLDPQFQEKAKPYFDEMRRYLNQFGANELNGDPPELDMTQ